MTADSDSVSAARSTLASPFKINFSPPGARKWFTARPKTRWRWTGRAELQFDCNDTVVRGRRARPFLPSAPQEIRFPSTDVLDVVANGTAVQCRVAQASGKPEPLSFWTVDAVSAQIIAARWPKEQSIVFQERIAFNRAIENLNPRVLVTATLVTINVLVYAAMVTAGLSAVQPAGFELVAWGSNFGPETLGGQWWRLFTSMFLHFGFAHLLFNMWALLSLGPLAEKLYGSTRYLFLYVVAGLAGSMASLLWNPVVNSAGASGAVFGVLGGLLAFFTKPSTKLPASVSAAQRNSALVFVAYNLLNGVVHAGIDNACHIGGLLAGFGMGWLLARPLDSEARTEEWCGCARIPHRTAADNRRRDPSRESLTAADCDEEQRSPH